jgi:hypothetical protein
MKKIITNISLCLFVVMILIFVFPSILIIPLTKKQIQIKCVEKDSWIRLTKKNHYYIIANHSDIKEEKFEIETPFLESNKECFNNFKKDSIYMVSVYGLKLPFIYRSISEIVKK